MPYSALCRHATGWTIPVSNLLPSESHVIACNYSTSHFCTSTTHFCILYQSTGEERSDKEVCWLTISVLEFNMWLVSVPCHYWYPAGITLTHLLGVAIACRPLDHKAEKTTVMLTRFTSVVNNLNHIDCENKMKLFIVQ